MKIFFRICIFLFFFAGCLVPIQAFSQVPSSESVVVDDLQPLVPPLQKDEFFRGQVVSVVSEHTKEEYGQMFVVQNIKVKLLTGQEKGLEVIISHELGLQKSEQKLKPGQKVILGKQQQDSGVSYYVSDRYRLNSLIWIGFFFFCLIIFFARTQGLRAFLGLLTSFCILFFYGIPALLQGSNPLTVSLVVSFGIVCTSLYIAHGFRLRTTIAFISIVITLGLSAFLSWIFVRVSHVTGLGTEEAFFLQTSEMFGSIIDLRGLLLAGFLIGTLGVLDDVATAQSATVEELHKANEKLNFFELYTRGISVGKEHIVSLVNTLILAYTGASFPLILLLWIYETPVWVTINSEMIAEEILRMLAGSTALVLAVPITTCLAAWIFSKKSVSSFDKSK